MKGESETSNSKRKLREQNRQGKSLLLVERSPRKFCSYYEGEREVIGPGGGALSRRMERFKLLGP